MALLKRYRFAFALLLTVALGSLCLVGCVKQEQPQQPQQQEAASNEQQKAPVEEDYFPESYFLTTSDGNQGGMKWAIGDLNGNITKLADDTWDPLGPFLEGYVLVSWETSEYDEEWDIEHDKVAHYGLVDKSGNMAIDLTEKLRAAVPEFRLDSGSNNICFVDGIMLLFGKGWGGSSKALIALNTNGDIVYTLGKEHCQIPFDLFDSSGTYHDGVLCLGKAGSSSLILDTSGNVLAKSEDSDNVLTSYGNGYMTQGYDPTTVTDYAGNVLFDVESVNVKDDIEKAKIAAYQPGAGGLVVVQAEKVNPYRGNNKKLAGIWSIPANKWIVPLSEGFDGYDGTAIANNGLVRVEAKDKAFITEGYGAKDADTEEEYVCLMDYEGNIVADLDTEIIRTVIQEQSLWREELVGDYLQNSLWLFCDKGSQETVSLVAYITDGAVQSIKALDYYIEGSYPNNESVY